MKKIYFIISIITFIVIVSFMPAHKSTLNDFRKILKPIDCEPFFAPNIDTVIISDMAKPSAIVTRRSFTSLSKNEKNAFEAAIKKMKNLSESDPTSLKFQVKFHKKHCPHGTSEFLAWHRAYIYYFEKIVRSKMGTAHKNFGLPYWDYQQNMKLPAEYRKKTSALFLSDRDTDINIGAFLLDSDLSKNAINNGIIKALKETYFFNFQDAIYTPHSTVHKVIAGETVNHNYRTMGTNLSPNDPLFWVHHSNIDRLWEVWINKGGGRCNPDVNTATAWANNVSKFIFYDIDLHKIVKVKPAFFLSPQIIGYSYDNIGIAGNKNISCDKKIADKNEATAFRKRAIYIEKENIPINKKETKMDFSNVIGSSPSDIIKLKEWIKEFALLKSNNNFSAYLEFKDLELNIIPAGAIEVYLNPINSSSLISANSTFLGTLDLYTAVVNEEHTDMVDMDKTLRINIDNYVKNISIKNLLKTKLVFVTKGNFIDGKEIITAADIKIGKMALAIYKNE